MIINTVVMPHIGGPSVLRVEQTPAPHAGAGQVVIQMGATGVSFAEVQMLRGRYFSQPTFPFVPGYDTVGTVIEVGPTVSRDLIGKRVAAITVTGGWADQQILEADSLAVIPESIDPAEAVAMVVNGITAYQLLHRVAQVKAGQTIVVHGASGGVGLLLVQMARLAGVNVIGTASATKLDTVRALGATAIDYRAPNLLANVRALAPQGVAAVLDHVGGRGLIDSWKMLGSGGTLVSYGSAATLNGKGHRLLPYVPNFTRVFLWNLLPNGRHATGYYVQRWPEFFRDDLLYVLTLLQEGKIQANVTQRFPLTHAAEALALLDMSKVTGKVVLVSEVHA